MRAILAVVNSRRASPGPTGKDAVLDLYTRGTLVVALRQCGNVARACEHADRLPEGTRTAAPRVRAMAALVAAATASNPASSAQQARACLHEGAEIFVDSVGHNLFTGLLARIAAMESGIVEIEVAEPISAPPGPTLPDELVPDETMPDEAALASFTRSPSSAKRGCWSPAIGSTTRSNCCRTPPTMRSRVRPRWRPTTPSWPTDCARPTRHVCRLRCVCLHSNIIRSAGSV